MSVKNFKYILILFTMLVPSLSFSSDLGFVYYHYENSNLVDSYKLLSSLNDVFENYFNFQTYLNWILFGFIVAIFITFFYVITGKEDAIILFEKFIWKDFKHNIIVTMAIIIFGYFLFIYPIPVIQVAPVISYDNVDGETELKVQAWLIDKKHSDIGTDSNGNIKLLHAPLIVALPLSLIEKFVYGFPSFENMSDLNSVLVLNPDTQRRSLVSGFNDHEYNEITGPGGACEQKNGYTDVNSFNTCLSEIADYKPMELSFLNHLNNSSAKIFVNVAEPFRELENILGFQESFLRNLSVEQDVLITSDKLKKDYEILDKFMTDTDNYEKYYESISEAFTIRVSEINKILTDSLTKATKYGELLSGHKFFDSYIKAYLQQMSLQDMQDIYAINYTALDNISDNQFNANKTPVDGGKPLMFQKSIPGTASSTHSLLQSAVANRDYYVDLFNSDDLKLKYNLFTDSSKWNVSSTSEINCNSSLQLKTYSASSGGASKIINNIHIDCIPYYNEGEYGDYNNVRLLDNSAPFVLDNSNTNFELKFDKEKLFDDISDKNTPAEKLIGIFWKNYQTKIFDKINKKINALDGAVYYQPTLTKKILDNLGIDSDGVDLTKSSKYLLKIEKISSQLFVLDTLIAFLKNKSYEAENKIFSAFGGYTNIKNMQVSEFKRKYDNVIRDWQNKIISDRPLIMGLMLDDYSFNIIPQSDPTAPSPFDTKGKKGINYGNQLLLFKVDADNNVLGYNDNGSYEENDDLIAQKGDFRDINTFLCDTFNDSKKSGMCLLYLTDNTASDTNNFAINTQSITRLLSLQQNLLYEVSNTINSNSRSMDNYDKKTLVSNVKGKNPCIDNSQNLSCAKYYKQELLKETSSSIKNPLTDSDNNPKTFTHLEAVNFVYSGLLRNINYKISTIAPHGTNIKQMSRGGRYSHTSKKNIANPTCTKTNKVSITGAEAYSNMKVALVQALRGSSNYIGSKLDLYVNILSSLGEDHLEIGNPGWSYNGGTGDDPYIKFTDEYANEVLEGMNESIENEGGNPSCSSATPNILVKRLCKVKEDFKNVASASPDESTFQREIDYMIRFLSIKTPMNEVPTDFLSTLFSVAASAIGNWYNRGLLIDNKKTFKGISKITPYLNMVMGGDFVYSDNRELSFDLVKEDVNSFKTELSLSKDYCESPVLKNAEEEDTQDDSDTSFGAELFDYFIGIALGGYMLWVLILPFLGLLALTYLATILGWIGIISIAYIAIINIIVFRNFQDLPIIKNEWYEPSKNMIKFFSKMVLMSVLLYLYLSITVFFISQLLVPFGETLTMQIITNAITKNSDTNLFLYFMTVMLLIATIYYAYIRISVRLVKDFFYTSVVDPLKTAKEHAENFAKKLSK